jgi:hypothetical protein
VVTIYMSHLLIHYLVCSGGRLRRHVKCVKPHNTIFLWRIRVLRRPKFTSLATELTPVWKYPGAEREKKTFASMIGHCHKAQHYFLTQRAASGIVLSLIRLTSIQFSLHLQYVRMSESAFGLIPFRINLKL